MPKKKEYSVEIDIPRGTVRQVKTCCTLLDNAVEKTTGIYMPDPPCLPGYSGSLDYTRSSFWHTSPRTGGFSRYRNFIFSDQALAKNAGIQSACIASTCVLLEGQSVVILTSGTLSPFMLDCLCAYLELVLALPSNFKAKIVFNWEYRNILYEEDLMDNPSNCFQQGSIVLRSNCRLTNLVQTIKRSTTGWL
jgi:hypothetical protein